MAYAFVNSGTFYNNAGTGSASVSYSATLGNTLLVAAITQTVGSSLTLSDTENTYSFLGATIVEGGFYLNLWEAHVTTGGSLTISLPGGPTYGMYVPEYSGLATSAYISSSFQSGAQVGPSLGANTITTGSNPNATSAPAMVFALSVNIQAISGPNGDPGPSLGTSFSFNSRTVGWLGSSSQQTALAEDIRVTSTGTQAMTFGCTGNLQFDTALTVAAAFVESATATSIAWIA